MRFANVTCGAPFSQTKAPAREPAALALWLFIPYFGYFSMQWLTTDWLGPNNQAVRQDVRAHVQGPLFGRRAHSRSLGFAPTARRGRRDEKGGRAVTFMGPLDRDGQSKLALMQGCPMLS